MKYNKDPRINTKSIGIRNYLFLLVLIFLICGCFTAIFFLQIDRGDGGGIYTFLSIASYLFSISFLVVFLLSLFYNRYINAPIGGLSRAARKVAEGDYTVHIDPRRSDGKKDEFEVLFEDFNSMVKELASTEVLKKDFISNVSHEIKTPIAIIQNYADLLQNVELSKEEYQEYAKRIGLVTSRMNQLITNILKMNRLDNQKTQINYDKFNLSEAVSRCLISFEELWEDKRIDIDIHFDPDVFVFSDSSLLDIVWNNLISNALKFTDCGGHVYISVLSENETALVTIKDTGCGIDEGALSRIFEEFYQGDTSHSAEGNGLGLSITSRILTLLGGTIEVESLLGSGTIFTVRIKKKLTSLNE